MYNQKITWKEGVLIFAFVLVMGSIMFAVNPEFMIEWWQRGLQRLIWFGIFLLCVGAIVLGAYIIEKIIEIKDGKK